MAENTPNEKTLLKRAHQADLQALAEIYDLFSPRLYAYAYRLLGEAQQAEDCVAETFRRFLSALQAGGGPEQYLQAYLYRIAHNWITDVYRRQPPPPLALDERWLAAADDPEAEFSEYLSHQAVLAALARLTEEQRQVIALKYFEGLDNQAIAQALDKPVGAVKALQHRALEALRRILAPAQEINS